MPVISKQIANEWIGAVRPVHDAYLSLNLPSELRDAVDEAAEENGMRRSAWVRKALVEALESGRDRSDVGV